MDIIQRILKFGIMSFKWRRPFDGRANASQLKRGKEYFRTSERVLSKAFRHSQNSLAEALDFLGSERMQRVFPAAHSSERKSSHCRLTSRI